MTSSLRVVSDDETVQSASPPEKEVLVCKVTDTIVTVTNPSFGTVRVAWDAFRQFCRIAQKHDRLRRDDLRSTAICDLSDSVSFAVRAGNDRFGNRLYVDENASESHGARIMYVICPQTAMLVAVFDKTGSPRPDR